MKIAITGHTSGIGKALADHFKHHEVTGFSRSNGYNISDPVSRVKIAENIKDFDVFINNAYNNFDDSQLELLKLVYKYWEGTDKIIINVSSRYTNEDNLYCKTKKKQDEFCEDSMYKLPHILNLKPGLIDTRRVEHITGNKLSLVQFLETVDYALNNKIHSITFGLR